MSKFVDGQYSEQELLDFEYFKQFAAHFPTCYTYYRMMEYGCRHDAEGYDNKGRLMNIELKGRKADSDSMSCCYIEPGKFEHLMTQYRKRDDHPLPVYINFIGDEKDVYLYRLEYLKSAYFHPNKLIENEEYLQDRIGLRWSDAWHYRMMPNGQYKLIHKGR